MEASRWADPRPASAQNSTHEPQLEDAVPPEVESRPDLIESSPEVTEAEIARPVVDDKPASAPSIPIPEPSYPPMNDENEFAQTIQEDDLFGDDFTPNAEPTVEHVPQSQPEEQTIQPPREPRHRGRGAPRARGGRGRGNSNAPPRQVAQGQDGTVNDAESRALLTVNGAEAPSGPKTEPVRGERHLSGGLARQRLTEDELNARLEAMKLKTASLEAAHARAAADEASFNAREAEAEVQRRKERKERQVMMGDREKNRQRKLNAQQGREWDAVKEDERGNEAKSRGSGFRRGAHGGIAGAGPGGAADEGYNEDRDDNSQYIWHEDTQQRGRGRGRGRAGRGRGGVSARGGAQQQDVPSAADFPSLASANPAEEAKTPSQSWPLQTPQGKASWADEMESPSTPTTK